MAAHRVDSLEDVYWRVFEQRGSYERPPVEVVLAGWRHRDPPDGPWADALRDRLGAAASVLDVGAGTREWEPLLERMGIGARYSSVDTETRHAHDHADFLAVTGSYDAVLMFELLEHLPLEQGLRFLQHAVDLLAPGGVLAISTPNPAHPTSFQQSDFTHVRPWPAHDLWALLRVAGLQPEVHRLLHTTPARRPLVPLRKLLSRLMEADPADHLLVFGRKTAG